jgi:cytochrome c oxidase subunit IV
MAGSSHAHDAHGAAQVKRIWKTFWLLLFITVVELGLGYAMYFMGPESSSFLRLFIKGVIVILSFAKAFYIIGIFMHLGDEVRNMIMTIAVPALLFIWFIAAFLWDGNSYKNLRNNYDPYFKERTMKQNELPKHSTGHETKPASKEEGTKH